MQRFFRPWYFSFTGSFGYWYPCFVPACGTYC